MRAEGEGEGAPCLHRLAVLGERLRHVLGDLLQAVIRVAQRSLAAQIAQRDGGAGAQQLRNHLGGEGEM